MDTQIKAMIRKSESGLVESLQELIRIPSVKTPPTGKTRPFGEHIAAALEWVLHLCESFGFRTKNCQGYAGWAEIGQGEEMIGILVHLDVVPEGSGWDYPPFDGEIHDGKLFGRGAVDDKGPAMSCIYAMKAILDSGIELTKRVRIIFGLDEESEWEDMSYYTAHEELPVCGFTPDADFPAVYGEKGILELELTMPAEESRLQEIRGGLVSNIVPDFCLIRAVCGGREVVAEKRGKAAHGSMPEDGVNAIDLAVEELYEQKVESPFIDFYHEKLSGTVYGEHINCAVEDAESGRLTMNSGVAKMEEGQVRLWLDIRYPVTWDVKDILQRISDQAEPYGMHLGQQNHRHPVYMEKDGELMTKLLQVYRRETGDNTEPLTMGGGTYARAMQNIVAFGPLFPGRRRTEHQKNEHILVEDLVKITEIYALAIKDLAVQPV